MEKRRILVISYFYAPYRQIGSVRWSKLVKYITASGWDADVLTTSTVESVDGVLAGELDKLGNIIFIDHKNKRFAPSEQQKEQLDAIKRGEYVEPDSSSSPVSIRIKKRTGLSALKHMIGMSAPMRFYGKRKLVSEDMKRSADFAEQAEKYIRDHGGLSKYDAVVSTYGPVADVMLALRLKKLYPDVPIIMDFRDPMDSENFFLSHRRRMRRLQEKVCKRVDGVCTVSNGVAEKLAGCCSKKINVITNGYDREDSAGIEPYETQKLILCYTGSVYIGLDDLTPLWKCVKELSDSGKIELSRIGFVYAGTSGKYILESMKPYGIDGILDDRGKVERAESLKLQKSADGLVMSRWNTKKSHGILSGKIYEYMLAGKPIIALVSGDLGGSELRSVIEKGRLGMAYEAASAERDSAALREYILKLYNERFGGIPAGYSPDRDVVNSFDYRSLAGEYMKLIESVIEEKAKD